MGKKKAWRLCSHEILVSRQLSDITINCNVLTKMTWLSMVILTPKSLSRFTFNLSSASITPNAKVRQKSMTFWKISFFWWSTIKSDLTLICMGRVQSVTNLVKGGLRSKHQVSIQRHFKSQWLSCKSRNSSWILIFTRRTKTLLFSN